MNNSKKVLIIAEAANPEWVSVPLVGWSLSQAISNEVNAHIVTQIRNRAAFLKAGLQEGKDFTAIDSESVAAAVYKVSNLLRGGTGKGWTTTTAFAAISYYYFEHLFWRRFSDELIAGKYSVVHRITPLSPTTPSIIAKRCNKIGIPFVIGPLNGGLPWPQGFDSERRKEREWLSYIRSAYKLLPAYSPTRKNANAIIVASTATYAQIGAQYHHKCIYIPENGILHNKFRKYVKRPISLPIRVSFVGRLVPYKGCDMLLEAAAPLIRHSKVTIDIIGDGPERYRLEKIAEQQQIESGVTFLGWVEHNQVQDRLTESDIFGFPSVREFGGGVVLEAMAVGLVPVVVDYGGPGELVTTSTGFRVPLGSRDQIISRFREVLRKLVQDPSIIRPIGILARERVSTYFTWAAKAKQISEVYDWVLKESPVKPNFSKLLENRLAR